MSMPMTNAIALMALVLSWIAAVAAEPTQVVHMPMNKRPQTMETEHLLALYQARHGHGFATPHHRPSPTVGFHNPHSHSHSHSHPRIPSHRHDHGELHNAWTPEANQNGNSNGVAQVITTSPPSPPLSRSDLSVQRASVNAIESRIQAGEGSHTISVIVGGQRRELIIDTGSGKTAFVCDGCLHCGNHLHQPFRFTNNTQYLTCQPEYVGDERHGGCEECVGGKCKYGQRYVEEDYWEAFKVADELAFQSGDGSKKLSTTVQFGCIYTQSGCFTEQASDGIMGFSRHPDSIVEQLYRGGATSSRLFAQCLAEDGGSLSLGGVDMAINAEPLMFTPLRDTGYQYWTVQLERVTVGDVALDVSQDVLNPDRGCVFDSGTTFVYLPRGAETAFIHAWREAMGSSQYIPVSDTFYDIGSGDDASAMLARLPSICFHFVNAAQLCMSADAYLYKLSPNTYAGTLFFTDATESTIIGASALRHHNILYDADKNRIGMARADCDRLATVHAETQSQSLELTALETNPGGDSFRAAFDHAYWLQVALAGMTCFVVLSVLQMAWSEFTASPNGSTSQNDGFTFELMP